MVERKLEDYPELDDTIDLREYIAILRARKWTTIIPVTLLITSAALGFSAVQTPQYQSEASVVVESTGEDAITDVETQSQIVASEPVATLVRQEVGFGGSTEDLLENLSVQAVTESRVLDIAYTSPDPELARDAADSFAESYIEYQQAQATEEIESDQEAIEDRINNASEQLTRLSDQLEDVGESDEGLTTVLETQRNILIARLGVLQQRLDDLETEASERRRVGEVIEPARLATSPASPNHITNGVLGLFLGLALGVGLAFLCERLDDRFRGRADLERALGVPVLATVPRFATPKRKRRPELVTQADPRGHAAEAYKTLRTNLEFIVLQHGIRTVLVTSPAAAEGKTVTVANLGLALAQAGRRVILVSADLRRPTIAGYFGVESEDKESGLSSWLVSDDSDPFSLLVDPGIANIRLIPSGPIPPNPAELLASHRMRSLLESLRDNADVVLVDAPPTLAVADVPTMASQVEGVVLVIDASVTHRSAAVHAKNELEQVGGSLIGCLLNAFDPSASPYYHYYYSPYRYESADEAEEPKSRNGDPEAQEQSRLRSLFGRR